MEAPVFNISGKVVEHIQISDALFSVPFNHAVVHQALLRQLANSRLGTADSKTRAFVEGSGKKLYAQKHTGRARQGSIRAPHRRGGGVAFGPHPRDFSQALPKKMRRLALNCLLSSKVAEGQMVIVDELKLEEAKTKQMKTILQALGAQISTLLVTEQADTNIVKSARNLPGIKTLPATLLNVVDLLNHQKLVMTVAAVRRAEETWAPKPPVEQGQQV